MSFLSSDSMQPTSSPASYDGATWRPQQEGPEFGQDVAKTRTQSEDEWGVSMGQASSPRTDGDNIKLLDHCPPTRDLHIQRTNWLSISILLLSVYSTVFSGIWLIIALLQPRWGRTIRSGGSLTPATASIIFTLFAKTIELSFVTVFVTFLGQVLSRRSLIKSSRGVTIAELTLRTWIGHAAFSFLGCITLVAAIISMFYTTASDALVSPHLGFGHWDSKVMNGTVKTVFANPLYMRKNCQTPITLIVDPDYSEITCLDIDHAGQSYHNVAGFLETWAQVSKANGGASPDLSLRPNATGTLFDNTTVIGSWITKDMSNLTESYQQYNRIVNNITLAMPHAGIIAAAQNPKNGIAQPADLEGVGEYSLSASVISSAVNVLCANVNDSEIAPLIYVNWPDASTLPSLDNPNQMVASADYQNDIQLQPGETYLNSTVIDDLFEWGPYYGRQPPVFPMLPIDYNSIANVSMPSSDAIYLLIKAADVVTTDYTLCELRSFLYPSCSTSFNISGLSGATLQTFCDDPQDKMRYDKSVPDSPISRNFDWKNVGWDWMISLSLNMGTTNGNSSTARMLANVIPTDNGTGVVELSRSMPSIAETLAVMAGNTLLLSTLDAGFYHYWQYTNTTLDPSADQQFNTSISSQQYTSGIIPNQKWQGIFYVVLVLVFATNIFCLVYLCLRAGLVTDYSEPQNLFALAVNSPRSIRMSGSCGAGPEGEQFNVDWHVKQDSSGHMFIQEGETGLPPMYSQRGDVQCHIQGHGFELRNRSSMMRSQTSYGVLSSKQSSTL